MDSVPPSVLAASLGALQIGVFLSHVLFGVTTTQTYIYYSRFPEDPPQLKALVSVVWICEFVHAMCIGDAVYDYTISNYGNPERLAGALPKSLMATSFLTAIIATLVQGFFTFRVHTLSKRLYITLVISVMLFLRLLSTCGVFVTGISMTSLLSFERQWGWMVIVSLVFSSAADLTITTLLVAFLLNQRFGVRSRTTALVDKLIAWTIETGLITRLGFPRLPFLDWAEAEYHPSISSTVVLVCNHTTVHTERIFTVIFLAMWVIVARWDQMEPRPDIHIQTSKATRTTSGEAESHHGAHDVEASKDA
ncbi:hypothetical protein DFH08DRAFT_816927 [Mycena albidolilacea]|uniref:DUF6534 domain-containing protein n=1 Tax=Mycena albidolilacea TaxID=1033008 RepID=A0AAD7EI45_9AGAR|nr:hypothetical protein DFH08DRAFT_816927 [Mycena albidolilacea]